MTERSAHETKSHAKVVFEQVAGSDTYTLMVVAPGDDWVSVELTTADLRRVIEAGTQVLRPE